MTELVFALTFMGQARAAPDSPAIRRATTEAPSQKLRTTLSADGVQSGIEHLTGETAVLESRVERRPDGSFVEDGTITYGSAGKISFVTVGAGTVGPSPIEAWQHGAVVWAVTGGDGRFAGARGLITSNFTVSADGRVVDNHYARIYLPE